MDYLHYSPCYDGDFSAEEYRYGYLSSQWTKVPISYALHWHEYFEIEFCVVGEFRSVINGVTHVIKAGSLTVVSPGDFHEVHIPNQDQVLIKKLSFVPEVMRPEIATHINSLQFPLVLTFTQEETEDLNYAFDLLKLGYQIFKTGYIMHVEIYESVEDSVFRSYIQSSDIHAQHL